jgi:hypothetical protein
MAKFYDAAMKNTEKLCLSQWRSELLGNVHGDILEIGSGTGVNLKYYPDTINQLVLSEPNINMRRWRLYSEPGWQFKKLDRIPTFAVDPVNPDRIYTIDENGDLAIFDGEEWHSTGVLALAGGIEVGNFVRSIAIDPNHPEIIYAGMFASGIPWIWRSVDGGDSWEDISNNLPRIGQRTMAVNPHTGELFTGSTVGTWVFPPPY